MLISGRCDLNQIRIYSMLSLFSNTSSEGQETFFDVDVLFTADLEERHVEVLGNLKVAQARHKHQSKDHLSYKS